jgi:hypothetical protein
LVISCESHGVLGRQRRSPVATVDRAAVHDDGGQVQPFASSRAVRLTRIRLK